MPLVDWKETRAGYEHPGTGWKVELVGQKGMWFIITDKGALSVGGRKQRFSSLESAISRAEEVMKKRGLMKERKMSGVVRELKEVLDGINEYDKWGLPTSLAEVKKLAKEVEQKYKSKYGFKLLLAREFSDGYEIAAEVDKSAESSLRIPELSDWEMTIDDSKNPNKVEIGWMLDKE